MVHEFWPFLQRKAHRELVPGDFVRVQGKWYIIDEVRRWRRPFEYQHDDADLDVQLRQLTGSMTKRFQHIDKVSVDPTLATCPNTSIVLTFRGVDVTGMQYGHPLTQYNANRLAPYELNNNSFSTEDIINITITYADDETGETVVWFSGEEYTLVDYKAPPDKPQHPARFVAVLPHGFSRVMTATEFADSNMDKSLRT